MQRVWQGEAGKVRVGERHEAEMRAMDSKLPLTPHFFSRQREGRSHSSNAQHWPAGSGRFRDRVRLNQGQGLVRRWPKISREGGDESITVHMIRSSLGSREKAGRPARLEKNHPEGGAEEGARAARLISEHD